MFKHQKLFLTGKKAIWQVYMTRINKKADQYQKWYWVQGYFKF